MPNGTVHKPAAHAHAQARVYIYIYIYIRVISVIRLIGCLKGIIDVKVSLVNE